jgi:PPK2 family polyphosphate:nucleotide phosphotransferase
LQLHRTVIEELMVHPGDPADLSERSTAQTRGSWFDASPATKPREVAARDLETFRSELELAQEMLFATDRYALLVILQALDAGGKDGTIKHVMSGVNPQGCDVVAFKSPSAEELEHDFLWRCARAVPARGRIGIFNRSYYEDVLIARVHPEMVRAGCMPIDGVPDESFWSERFDDINAFERHLHRNGTRIIKLFLHVSKEEQRRRLLERINEPAKQWKFSSADLAERAYFDEYLRAYEAAMGATSTPWAPWYVVPADHKYVAHALVGGILTHCVKELDLQLPPLDAEQARAIDRAREALAE